RTARRHFMYHVTPNLFRGLVILSNDFLLKIRYTLTIMLNFVMKKLVQRQIKDMPKDQQEMIMNLIDENPELLKTISTEIQAKVKKGIDQQTAMMQVMMDHKDELQRAMMKYKK
ncbi:MAG: hypothetical protein RLY49_426, partial [Candidatus Parcubacteria bacterium]